MDQHRKRAIIAVIALSAVGLVCLWAIRQPHTTDLRDTHGIVINRGSTPHDSSHGYFGIQFDPEIGHEKLMIVSVLRGSPADAAGLRAGDAIIEMGGITHPTLTDFAHFSPTTKPGETLSITFLRGGVETEVPLRLMSKEEWSELQTRSSRL